MSRLRPLRGACNCGRNHYSVVVPEDATEQAVVYFDDSSASRRSQATPLTAWLRVPLPWFSSSTEAQFPDETHTSIRRTFTPQHEPHCQRIFCGYCGSHLSYWTEQPPAEAEYMNITLGSLVNDDLRALQELDLLPEDVEPATIQADQPRAVQAPSGQRDNLGVVQSQRSGNSGGISWFEEMLDGSRLGRTRTTRRGQGASADGKTTIEWEVSEYVDDGTSESSAQNLTGSKRKIEVVAGDEDGRMQT